MEAIEARAYELTVANAIDDARFYGKLDHLALKDIPALIARIKKLEAVAEPLARI